MYTNIELFTRELKNAGFSKYKISKMVSSGELIRLKRGYYFVNSHKNLLSIGEKLLESGEEELGYDVLSVYFSYYPDNFELAYNLFKRTIKMNGFTESVPYFKSIYDNPGSLSKKDKNLLLHVLSMMVSMPKEYQEKDNKLTFKDVRTSGVKQNNIRWLIMTNRFDKALELIEKENVEELTDFDILLKELLNKCVLFSSRRNSKFLNLVKHKEYDKLANILYGIEDKDKLNNYMLHVLYIVEDILDIVKTGNLPHTSKPSGDTLYDFIESANYHDAFNLFKKSGSKHGPLNENPMYLLLKDITDKINDIKNREVAHKVIKEKLKNPYNVYSNERHLELESKKILSLFKPIIDEVGVTIISSWSASISKNLVELVNSQPDLICFPINRHETPALVIQKVLPKEKLEKLDSKCTKKIIKALVNNGKESFKSERYGGCIKSLKRVLLYGKSTPVVYGYLGKSYAKMGDAESAFRMYSIANQVSGLPKREIFSSESAKISERKDCSTHELEDAPKLMKKTLN